MPLLRLAFTTLFFMLFLGALDAQRNEKNAELLLIQLQENRTFMLGNIALFSILALFLIYIIRLRDKSYKELQAKNVEIEAHFRKLEESNEILRQFAYIAAHDLKEPLRSIGSYTGLIQMKYRHQLDPTGLEYMNFVNSGVKRMYNLLNDLLAFSQVLSQERGCEVVRPEEVLQEVKDNLRTAIESRNARIEYNCQIPSIRMNRIHLLQLFQNLVGNALKYSEKQPIVSIDGKEQNGEMVLTVADNGIGIKPEYASKVFVLFQQLHKNSPRYEGTGIGLTICKNIVEKYNGKIWFESEENKGTTFFISLPQAA